MTPVDWVLAAGLSLSLALVLALHRRQAALERQLRAARRHEDAPVAAHALQGVGLVRYRAFNDVGGDHSFALSLVDANGDGVVVNGIYHRDRCRVYAKPVVGWESPSSLTEEEVEAVRRARVHDAGVDWQTDGH